MYIKNDFPKKLFNLYKFTTTSQVECDKEKNDEFEQFVCECDRVAAECFKNNRKTFNQEIFHDVDFDECCGEKPTDKCEAWTGKGYQASPVATEKPKVVKNSTSTSAAPASGGSFLTASGGSFTLLVVAALLCLGKTM